MKHHAPRILALGLAWTFALASTAAFASDWSDTAIGWRTGSRFREPHNPDHIGKNILSLTHASGYRYGNQFINLDLLKSDRHDPASADGNQGALEGYLIYRHTLDLGKLSGRTFDSGSMRGIGLSAGIDLNYKDDVAYNSRKRMWVLGPQIMWKVPGRLNTSLLMAWESNAPHGPYPPISGVSGRYHYTPHPMLAIDWGIPLGAYWSFDGFANFIAAKGRNEVGVATGAETNIDMRLMLDAGALMGARKRAFLVGIQYQYWHNKFGNTRAATNGEGYVASTPMLRVSHHF